MCANDPPLVPSLERSHSFLCLCLDCNFSDTLRLQELLPKTCEATLRQLASIMRFQRGSDSFVQLCHSAPASLEQYVHVEYLLIANSPRTLLMNTPHRCQCIGFSTCGQLTFLPWLSTEEISRTLDFCAYIHTKWVLSSTKVRKYSVPTCVYLSTHITVNQSKRLFRSLATTTWKSTLMVFTLSTRFTKTDLLRYIIVGAINRLALLKLVVFSLLCSSRHTE